MPLPVAAPEVRAELPGILAWAVKGTMSLAQRMTAISAGQPIAGESLEEGILGTCDAVKAATKPAPAAK